jgi:predicted metal-dependent enzyme (double-stranded beta helix superfamily)
MKQIGIEDDLQRTLNGIVEILAPVPDDTALQQVAALLAEFVERHRAGLSFEHFPLPTEAGDALCCYELQSEGAAGLTLYLNSIRGGVDSAVHDHGTWAVIVAIEGRERNRLYRRTDDGSDADRVALELEREVVVRKGQPLVLAKGIFHSIHTVANEPTLQLHVYGQAIDRISGRHVAELETGKLAHLPSEASIRK